MYDLDTELMRLQHTRPLEHAFENSARGILTSARENELWVMSGRKNSSSLTPYLPQSNQKEIVECSPNSASNTQEYNNHSSEIDHYINEVENGVNTRKDDVYSFTQTMTHSPMSNLTPSSNGTCKIIKRRPQHIQHYPHSSLPWQKQEECNNGINNYEYNNNNKYHIDSDKVVTNNNDDNNDGGEVRSREELDNAHYSSTITKKHQQNETNEVLLNAIEDTNTSTTHSSFIPQSASSISTHEQLTQSRPIRENNTTYSLHTNKSLNTKLLHSVKYIHTTLPTNEEEVKEPILTQVQTSQANLEIVIESSLPLRENKHAAGKTNELLFDTTEMFAKEHESDINKVSLPDEVNEEINASNNITSNEVNLCKEQIDDKEIYQKNVTACWEETQHTLANNIECNVLDSYSNEHKEQPYEYPHYVTTSSTLSSENNVSDKETNSVLHEIPTVSSYTVTSEPTTSLAEASATNTFVAIEINEKDSNEQENLNNSNNSAALTHSAKLGGKEELVLQEEKSEHVIKVIDDDDNDDSSKQSHQPQQLLEIENKSTNYDLGVVITESSTNDSHICTKTNETSNWLSTASLSSLPSFTLHQLVEDVDDKCEPIPRAHPPVQTENSIQPVQESNHSFNCESEKETVSAECNPEISINEPVTYLHSPIELTPAQTMTMPLEELAKKEFNMESEEEKQEIQVLHNLQEENEHIISTNHLGQTTSEVIRVTNDKNESRTNTVTEEPIKLISIVSKEGNQAVEWVVHPTRHELTPLIPRLPLAEVVAKRERRKRALAEKQNAQVKVAHHNTYTHIMPNNNNNINKKINNIVDVQLYNSVLQPSTTLPLSQTQAHYSTLLDNLSDDGLWCKSISPKSPLSSLNNIVVDCPNGHEGKRNASFEAPSTKTKNPEPKQTFQEQSNNKMQQHIEEFHEQRELESVQSHKPKTEIDKSNLKSITQIISKTNNLHCTVPHTSSIADDLYCNSNDVTIVNISPVDSETDECVTNIGSVANSCTKASNVSVNEKNATSPNDFNEMCDVSSNNKHEYEKTIRWNNTDPCVYTHTNNNVVGSINANKEQEQLYNSNENKNELTRNSMTKTSKSTHCCVIM